MIKKMLITAAAVALTMSTTAQATPDDVHYNYVCAKWGGGALFTGTTDSLIEIENKRTECTNIGGAGLLYMIVR